MGEGSEAEVGTTQGAWPPKTWDPKRGVPHAAAAWQA